MIVAYGKNRAMGNCSQLPWEFGSLPSDMRHFQRETMGKSVIMGTKTFISLKRPDGLPGRENIVVSRRTRDFGSKVLIAHSIEEALDIASREPIIIGGAAIYELAMPLATKILATEVDGIFHADTHFPRLGDEWKETEREHLDPPVNPAPHEKVDRYPLDFVTLEKVA